MRKYGVLSVVTLAALVACEDSHSPLDLPDPPAFDLVGVNASATLNAVSRVMSLNFPGSPGTTTIYVSSTTDSSDPVNGCNFRGPNPQLVINVTSSDPAVATVTPSVTMTKGLNDNCSTQPQITVTPVSAGSVTISFAEATRNSDLVGTFNFTNASFTVNVAGPSNTAPTVAIAGVTGGARYNKGSVPAATCQVTDIEDGNSSFAATLSAITGPYANDGIGSQTASCSYTDAGGLTASDEVIYNIVDPLPPSITYVLNPSSADGSNGWYKSAVTLTWTVTENESPNSLQKTGCVNQNITADQAETDYACSASSAGGSAAQVVVKIKRDATAPTISGAATTLPNANGWYKGDVVIQWLVSDVTSGIDAANRPGNSAITGEGNNLGAGPTSVSDMAGNTNSASVSGIKIDRTAPTNVTFVGGISAGISYAWGSVPAKPTCTADDSLSGVKECVVSGYNTYAGTHILTATAEDNAGNVETATMSYTVDPWDVRGFYQPVGAANTYNTQTPGSVVWNTVKGGSTVPLKFHIFRGTAESTDVADVKSFTSTVVSCGVAASAGDEPVALLSSGNTSLRYDPVERQFIQNWKTPSVSTPTCYRVTLETQDGSIRVAFFRLNR